MGYLTGMRLDEIARRKTSQFHEDAEGNPCIHTEGGKNDTIADREVPIQPALIEAVPLDWARGCSGGLFPKVHCSNEVQDKAYSQWYGPYLNHLGRNAKSKVFHGLRHLVKHLCKNAGLKDVAVDRICGHEPGTVAGRYGVGRRINVWSDLLAKEVPAGQGATYLPVICGAWRLASRRWYQDGRHRLRDVFV